MSSAASPSVARSASSARRPQPLNSTPEKPSRSQSTRNSSSAVPPPSPHRTQSHTQGHGRTPSSSQHPNLANVARRDYEQTNVAQPPATSRRSISRDRGNSSTHPPRNDSMRAGSRHRTSSATRHTRYGSESHGATGQGPEGSTTDGGTSSRLAPGSSGSQQRRRTAINAQTGQWSLGKTIGAGSMGKVKLARNQETGEQVAVKIVPRQSTDEHRSAADKDRADHSKEIRTAREAAIVTLVNHPYICGMRDVVRTNYHWYMLFEYVNGGQMLDYIISHGRLKEKQARKFGRQIASALDYCHRNSIVHRDLKIENILISKTGDIKIIDFGLSNLFAPRNHLKTFCGSLYFAAPELLQAKQYTGPEVDIWSFGIVLYVLVCGKVPFDDQSMPQLHIKIKKGQVDYPSWLSQECKSLIGRMLVTDPRHRAGLAEIMNHPWLTKGYGGPPDNFLPPRLPLQLPLDSRVIEKMTGFDFGSQEYITTELTRIIESEDYQSAVKALDRKKREEPVDTDRKKSVFDFYKRRNSISRDTLSQPSSEGLALGYDPVNAFSPLISVYYLVREKQERELQEANPGATQLPTTPGQQPLQMPDLPAPETAYTNSNAYEMKGEAPTGGRNRPRARTHGEDEVTSDMKKLNVNTQSGQASPTIVTPPTDQAPAKRENAAVGLLRRLSTRRSKEPDRPPRSNPPPPALAVSGPNEATGPPPRKSFSVRRPKDREHPPPSLAQAGGGGSHATGSGLLSPPSSRTGKLMGLARSTSVNSGDMRRRLSRRAASEAVTAQVEREPPATSGSDNSSIAVAKTRPGEAASDDQGANRNRIPTSRAKSLGHARRESIQARRAQRAEMQQTNVPEETDAEGQEDHEEATKERGSPEGMRPVYLKGLFSVSTTSSKPLPIIRTDIIRVLKQLGVQYHEIKGGFACKHSPSIDLTNEKQRSLAVVDTNSPSMPTSPAPQGGSSTTPSSATTPVPTPHKRKISFGFMSGDRDRDEFRAQHQHQPHTPQTPRSTTTTQQKPPNPRHEHSSYPGSEDSDTSENAESHQASGKTRQGSRPPRVAAPAAGETSTHVRDETAADNRVLKFEIVVVKVPLFSLHGIQFKKVDGGTWQYKNIAQTILGELRL
ncbi:MAG: serine/threonine-protein kinase KIN2 [Bogoriella megaspora]|nr:MAG: serine/threonine-protein kinase KIN2 [Bogoriella megaspora]